MNEDEATRLFSRAAESIPPMSHQQASQLIRGGQRMQRRHRLLGVGAVAAVAALLFGAGVQLNQEQPAYAAAPSEESARVQALSDAIFSSFNGTQSERNAGAVLKAYALNGGLSRCMEAAGFADWDWSTPRSQEPESSGLGTSDFFALPLSREYTTALLDTAESIKADQNARTRDLTHAQNRQVTLCLESPPTTDHHSLSTPREAARLRDLWWEMVAELDAKYGDPGEKARCITAATIVGMPDGVSSQDEASLALYELRPNDEDLPESRQDPLTNSREWLILEEAEAAWETVDWGCRGEAYNRSIEAVGAAVQEFSNTHAADIAATGRQWEEISEKAASLGYDGTSGPIL